MKSSKLISRWVSTSNLKYRSDTSYTCHDNPSRTRMLYIDENIFMVSDMLFGIRKREQWEKEEEEAMRLSLSLFIPLYFSVWVPFPLELVVENVQFERLWYTTKKWKEFEINDRKREGERKKKKESRKIIHSSFVFLSNDILNSIE